MRTIALETSARTGSIALFEGPDVVLSAPLPAEQRSAQSLAGELQKALRQANWQPQQIDLVALSTGPGSFTGLRVGVTTAKIFAYATNSAVIGVNTLEVIAAAAESALKVWAVVDAQRQRVFAAQYALVDGKPDCGGRPACIVPTNALAIADWIDRLQPGDAVSGPILEKLQEALPPHVQVVDRQLWYPTAEWVGRLAIRRYRQGDRDDLWQLVPQYFQKSAAEEKRDAKSGQRRGPTG